MTQSRDQTSTDQTSTDQTTLAAFVVIWEFSVEPEARPAFEKAYGPNGNWAQLFRHSSGYLGTHLLHDVERPGRYLTLDRWVSREAMLAFKQAHAAEYQALDRQCEALTKQELLVGEFNPSVPVAGAD